MGSLFSSPKMRAVAPPPPADDTAAQAETEERLRAIARRRRGRLGTIATTPTGVRFTGAAAATPRRALLGIKTRLGE